MGSNLLYKASIVTTPTAYGVGVLNSIKPAIPFGEEIVTNGNFTSDSDWTKTNATISGGQATVTVTGGAFSGVAQTRSYTSGRKYRLIANIKGASGSSGKQIRFMDNSSDLGGLNTSNGKITLNESEQNVEIIWTANSNSNIIRNDRDTSSGDYSWDIYDISIKEITDADFDFTRTSSATRVNPDYLIETVSINSANLVQNGNFSELGSQLVVNGDFSNGTTGWNSAIYNSELSIDNGQLKITNTSSRARAIQGITTVVGKTYKFQASFRNGDVAAGIRLKLSNTFNLDSAFYNSSLNTTTDFVTTTHYFTATATTTYLGTDAQGSVGTISFLDNVSVKQVDPNNNWTLGTGWSFGTDKLERTPQSGSTSTTQSFSFNAGVKYKISYNLNISSGSFKIRISGGTLIDTPVRTTNGTYTETITANSGNNVINLRANDAAFSGSITNISVIEIQENGVPRLDYTNGTASILLEPQSTNLIPYSQDLSQLSNSNLIINTNSVISPDGTINAARVVPTTNISQHRFTPNITVSTSTFYTGSIFAKADGYNRIKLVENATTGGNAIFDLQNDTILTTNGVIAKIEAFPNDWYRCSITETTASTSFRFDVIILDDSSNLSFAGDGTSAVQLWGYQLEEQSFATSYIPTSGSTVTRAAETLNNAGNSDLINSTEGVLYAEIAALANPVDSPKNITISDGTPNNYVRIEYYQDGRVYGNVYDGASVAASFVVNQSNFNKIAIQYSSSGSKLYVNGTGVNFASKIFTSNTLNTIQFSSASGTSDFFGRCKTVAVFKEALSDTELACLTSTNNREIFLNYYYRMQYVGANTEALNCAQQTFNV